MNPKAQPRYQHGRTGKTVPQAWSYILQIFTASSWRTAAGESREKRHHRKQALNDFTVFLPGSQRTALGESGRNQYHRTVYVMCHLFQTSSGDKSTD